MRPTRTTQVHATLLIATMILVSSSALGQTAADQDPNKARPGESADAAAERINEEGKALVRAGKYEEALDKFHASLALFQLSNAIFNVGSMLYTLKQYTESFPYLEQTLRAPLAPEQRAVVLKHRANVVHMMRMSHKDILVRTNPPGAKLALNGVALPFPAPTRVLMPFGAADLSATFEGFKPKTVVLQSSSQKPPTDTAIRLEREEPYAKISARCPVGSDVFVDGQMQGFELVRTKLLIGEHTIRCGKTSRNAAFERTVTVRKGLANAFDFSPVKK